MSVFGKGSGEQQNWQEGELSPTVAAMLCNIQYASEGKLLEYIQEGSEAERKRAFLTLYDRYGEEIWSFIKSRVSWEEEAREIFNDVWELSQSGLLNFVWPEEPMSKQPLKSWLCTSAENKINAYHRSQEQEGTVGLEKGKKEQEGAVGLEQVGFFMSNQEPPPAFISETDYNELSSVDISRALKGSNAPIERQKSASKPDLTNNSINQQEKSTKQTSWSDEGSVNVPAAGSESPVWQGWVVLQWVTLAGLLILFVVVSRYATGVTGYSAEEQPVALESSMTATPLASSPTPESTPMLIMTTTQRPTATRTARPTVTSTTPSTLRQAQGIASRPPLPLLTSPPMRYPSTAISVDNAGEVTQLARWGKEAVNDIAYSPNGRLLAVASSRGIYLYDSRMLRQGRLIESDSTVHTVVFSPDGRLLAAGLSDHTVRLWRTRDGTLFKTLEGHSGAVRSVAFSADGQTVASGSSDGTVQLWGNPSTLRQAQGAASSGFRREGLPQHADGIWWHTTLEMEGGTSSIESVAFNPDGQTLALGSSDGTLWVWRVSDRTLLYSLEGHTLGSMVFSPDGETLALGSGNEVWLWRASDGKLLRTLKGHTSLIIERIESVAFSPNGNTLASGSNDGVHLWRVSDGQLLHTLEGHSSSVLSVAFSPDGQTLASASQNDVWLWRVSDGKRLRTLEEDRFWVECMALSPDGQTLALGSVDGSVWLWRVTDGKLLHILEGHTFWVSSVAFSPDGQSLASGSHDGVRLWRVSDGQPLQNLEEHPYRVLSAVFAPDGQTLASGSRDGVRLWQVSDGKLLHVFKGHSAVVLSIAFTPDGQTQALGSREGVKLFRVSDGTLLHSLELEGHTSWVSSVAFTPDGQTLASVSPDGVRLWQVSDGQLLRTLEGDRVSTVAFSPDMQTLAWGSDDGVSLWRMSDGQRLRTLDEHTDRVSSVTFSADGQLLASGSHDGTVRLWGIPPE